MEQNNKQKYVLCIACAGFNDTLARISHCYNYCKKYNRTLLIDTTKFSVVANSFDNYFDFINQEIPVVTSYTEITKLLTQPLTTFPNSIQNKFPYFMFFRHMNGKMREPISQEKIEFDCNTDYDEELIVYCQLGGGRIPPTFLSHLRMNNEFVKQIIADRKKQLADEYIGIQIRNTDIKTDYKKIFEDNKDIFENNNTYLATDSKDAQNYYKDRLPNLVTFTDTSMTQQTAYINRKLYMADVLSDLHMLAFSSNIIHGTHSGYVMLAKTLNSNKDVATIFFGL